MAKVKQKEGQEFLDEVNLCIKKTSGIRHLMWRLEEALKTLRREDCDEIALAAMQDLNILLGGLIKIWDQWASGMSVELDRLIEYKRQQRRSMSKHNKKRKTITKKEEHPNG